MVLNIKDVINLTTEILSVRWGIRVASMIQHTFQIIPSVGAKKERTLWESGTLSWDDFLKSDTVPGIKPALKEKGDSVLMQAAELLDDGDSRLLADMVPKGEHWRMFDRFRDDVAYIDIETDGLSRDSLVTVLTVHKPGRTVTLTHGRDLDAGNLADALDGAKMFVSYNGSCFDIPVLKNSFPTVDLDLPHFDLRFASRKVGFTGGLKPLEIRLGISRADEIDGVDGAMAVRLWKMWEKHNDDDALEILTEYNRADTVNLERIADIIYGKMVREHAGFNW